MRILQIATLFSPDGAYGGPTRVAVNQCRALRARGHDVIIAGGADGYATRPVRIDGVPARLSRARQVLPGAGFAGLAAPGILRLLAEVRAEIDVVHVHLARDLVTLPALRLAQLLGLPTVAQTHGMIDLSGNPLAGPLDRLLTGPALRAAGAVLHLTDTERRDLAAAIPGDLAFTELPNGVPEPESRVAATAPPEVLFLARLQERKRPELFVDVARELVRDGIDAVFTVAGPDGGRRSAVVGAAGSSVRVEDAVDPDRVSERIGHASVYVLPSVDEPYPMAVLEAMAVGRPVVITESCGLAPVVRSSGCGIVVDESREGLRAGIEALLRDPAAAAEMGVRGAAIARARFGMPAIAEQLETVYDRVLSAKRDASGVRG